MLTMLLDGNHVNSVLEYFLIIWFHFATHLDRKRLLSDWSHPPEDSGLLGAPVESQCPLSVQTHVVTVWSHGAATITWCSTSTELMTLCWTANEEALNSEPWPFSRHVIARWSANSLLNAVRQQKWSSQTWSSKFYHSPRDVFELRGKVLTAQQSIWIKEDIVPEERCYCWYLKIQLKWSAFGLIGLFVMWVKQPFTVPPYSQAASSLTSWPLLMQMYAADLSDSFLPDLPLMSHLRLHT